MEVLIPNSLPSGTAATSSFAADFQALEQGVAPSDFSALLALGLAAPMQAQAAPEQAPADPAQGADPKAQTADATALLGALAQQPPAAETVARTTQADSDAADVVRATTRELRPAPGMNKALAAVADAPANIAAEGRGPQHAKEILTAVQDRKQAPDAAANLADAMPLDVKPASSDDAPQRPESPGVAALHGPQSANGAAAHAAPVHPLEHRAPLSQPSALLDVQAPVSEPGFAQALTRQVVWMVDKDAQIAELRINPPELGLVQVRLTLTQDSAAAEFVSPHAEVRAAIENAIVRLREAMADAGIQLGEASVRSESFSAQSDSQAQARSARNEYREAPFNAGERSQPGAVRAITARGLVDVFA